MDDGKSEADAVTEDPPPEMCIVSMSKEDVRAWLQLKCDDEESQFFKSMRSPRGEILATRTRDRFKSDIGDDGIAEDIFTQVTINLETYGSDTITPKMFAAVMKTRGTPVTQQHPPQEDASDGKAVPVLSTSHWLPTLMACTVALMVGIGGYIMEPVLMGLGATSVAVGFVMSTNLVTVVVGLTLCVLMSLLLHDIHFELWTCAILSVAYWTCATWIGWTMSLPVGGGLVCVAWWMRRSWLLFPDDSDASTQQTIFDWKPMAVQGYVCELLGLDLEKAKDNELNAKFERATGRALASASEQELNQDFGVDGVTAKSIYVGVSSILEKLKDSNDKRTAIGARSGGAGPIADAAAAAHQRQRQGDSAGASVRDGKKRRVDSGASAPPGVDDFDRRRDPDLEEWATGLRDGTLVEVPENGLKYLCVARGVLGMDNKIVPDEQVLIVRDFFDKLHDAAVKPWGTNFLGRPTPTTVLGTPGVGKSIFRNYVARRLMLQAQALSQRLALVFDKGLPENTAPFIVVEQGADGALRVAQYDHSELADVQRFVSSAYNAGAVDVSLVDIGNGGSHRIETTLRMCFSSPNTKIMTNFEPGKSVYGHQRLWMPMWKKFELEAAHPIVCRGKTLNDGDKDLSVPSGTSPTLKLMRERIERFGYTARVAFKDNIADYDEKLDQKLKEDGWRFRALDQLDQERGQLISQASHSFIHADVPDRAVEAGSFQHTTKTGDPVVPTLQWASRWVRARVAEEAIKLNDETADAVMNGDAPSGVKGELIEDLWLQRIVTAVKLKDADRKSAFRLEKSRKQPEGDKDQPTADDLKEALTLLTDVEVKWVFKDDMSKWITDNAESVKAERGVLLRPFESTMSAIDAIMIVKWKERLWCIFLQVTIAETHPTKKEASLFLESLVNAANGAGCKSVLVFVVPTKRFNKNNKFAWVRQAIDGAAKTADNLIQFALCPGFSKS